MTIDSLRPITAEAQRPQSRGSGNVFFGLQFFNATAHRLKELQRLLDSGGSLAYKVPVSSRTIGAHAHAGRSARNITTSQPRTRE